MATSTSGHQGQRSAHSKVYSLGGNRRDEPAKQNPWHKYCKEYATKNNISYAAAISLASPSWRTHKEKNGLSFRDRTRRAERQTTEPMHEEQEEEDEGRCPSPVQRERPRKPKQTFRKDDYKRVRNDGCDQDHQPQYEDRAPKHKKKRVKKERAEQPSDADFARYQEFLKYRSMES